MPRKVKTAFTATDEDRAITGIHDVAYIPRVRDGVRGFEMRVGGGTSIMPRDRPDALRLRRGRQRRLPEGRRGRLPDLQPPGLAAREPRPRAHQGLRRQVRHRRAAPPGRGGAQGRLGRRARLLGRGQVLRRRRGGRRAGRARHLRDARTATCPASSASARRTSSPQRQAGFSTVEVKVTRGDLTPEQFRGLRPDHARLLGRLRPHHRGPEPGAALGARRDRLRRLAAPERARPRRRRRPAGDRRGELPGHRLLQARHHELDGPQRGRAGAARGDGHHRPAHAQGAREDLRLPQRLRPAPHRAHRLHRARRSRSASAPSPPTSR